MSAWRTVRLDQCCEIVAGGTPNTNNPDYWDGDICWATPKDLSNLEGAYLSDTPRKLTKAGLDSCAATILQPGSVLFSSRAPIGHVAVNTVPMATNQGFKSFVADPKQVHAKFMYHWLRRNRPYLESLGNGATFKEVSKTVVSRIEIALPPVAEQQRIADVLDRAEALRAKRRAALAILDDLTQAIFRDMFAASPATSCVLDECAEVVSGIAKGRKLGGRVTEMVPYLRVANVQAGYLDLGEIKTIEALPSEVSELRLMPGDVVLTEGGDFDKLGRGAMWEGQLAVCIHQNHVFRVRVDQSRMLPQYFHDYLQTDTARQYFLRCAKRTTNLAILHAAGIEAGSSTWKLGASKDAIRSRWVVCN